MPYYCHENGCIGYHKSKHLSCAIDPVPPWSLRAMAKKSDAELARAWADWNEKWSVIPHAGKAEFRALLRRLATQSEALADLLMQKEALDGK